MLARRVCSSVWAGQGFPRARGLIFDQLLALVKELSEHHERPE
jgi:hypothetical protein